MQYAYWIILTIYTLITLATIVRILLEHRQPAITMAWVMVLAFLPCLLYTSDAADDSTEV